MDEETVQRLESEIEELNTIEDASEDQDTVDGFKEYVKKQLDKVRRKFGKSSPEPSLPSDSSSVRDFKEHRTAFVSAEVEHKGQRNSDDIYDFNHSDRGLAVIINNEDFSASTNFGPRPGSSYDEASLYQTFKKLGFKVLVKRNLKAIQMLELFKVVKDEYDHANADCFVCSILTHGDETITKDYYERHELGGKTLKVRQDLLFGVDGTAVSTKNVVEFFNDELCPGLKGKPRLFFFQACRGSKYDNSVEVAISRPVYTPGVVSRRGTDRPDFGTAVDQPDSRASRRQNSFSSSVDPPEYHQRLLDITDAKPMKVETGAIPSGVFKSEVKWTPVKDVPISPPPLYKDCLVMYATPPGHYSWRRGTGSWFMQSLCKVLDCKEISRMSLLKALVIVSGFVAKYYESITPDDLRSHQKKEIPVIESMLVKDVYFTKKEDLNTFR